MKKFAIFALAAAIALPASAAGVTISGYIDVGYIAAQSDFNGSTFQGVGATNGTINVNDGFTLNEVDLDVSSQLTNDISAFASADFVNGNAVGIDYAYIDIANPGPFDLNVRMGRIPSVLGIEQRVSESNQSIFISRSLLSPITVGSQDGVAIYGSFSPVNYAIAVTNQDNIGGNNLLGALGLGSITNFAPGDTQNGLSGTSAFTPGNNNGSALANGLDNNNALNISGRLGVAPIEGLEVGVSYGRDVVDSGAGVSGERNTLGVDASYSFGALSLKGEWARVTEDALGSTSNSKSEVKAYYIEAGYDVNSKIGVGVRYSNISSDRASNNNMRNTVSTIAVSGAYRLADNVMLKAEYDINDEAVIANNTVRDSNGGGIRDIDNDVFALSLVGSF